ncbi:S9 family peptidase [Pleionea sp. CnH1-48]|uniref:S9 family peptidase n=1 Tax=Pleionea sp. CnH1-48 TaxID=2954494 RepID=UPI002097242E|nr:S9 family peptidase [Pleionea sp. CnH1-48]MCO7226796.1 S9 family peptidase [Pleionea sp. CnH1-48]
MKKISIMAAAVLSIPCFHLELVEAKTVVADPSTKVSLEVIMSDPDWMGRFPEQPYWSDDSQTIFFNQKERGHNTRQLMRQNLTEHQASAVSDGQLDKVDARGGVISADKRYKAYSYDGDIYLKELSSGKIKAITSTTSREHSPRFLSNGQLSFQVNHQLYSVDVTSGLQRQLAGIYTKSKPEDWKEPKDFLGAQQRRLFDYVRTQQDEKVHAKKRRVEKQKATITGKVPEFYLGKGVNIESLELSPNGRWVFVAVSSKKRDKGKADNMPRFITEHGYVDNDKVRALVGTAQPNKQSFYVLDLADGSQHPLSIKKLPSISKDPLASLKKKAAKSRGDTFKPTKKPRAVYIHNWFGDGVQWSPDGSNLAVNLFSYDNKDRWMARVDFDKFEFKSLHHLHNEAWVNDWTFNEMGWLNDNKSFYYLSEQSGYSHLYLKPWNKKARALTKGKFEVSSLTLTDDDQYIYYQANEEHPGIYEIYRVNLKTRKNERLTQLGGVNQYRLSPDEKQLLITHSTTTEPPELYWQAATTTAKAKRLTNTVSSAFQVKPWVKPEIVAVPSNHADQPIYSRLYKPKNFDPKRADKYPAVIFIHGAGYLQNSHQGWSGYFREFMFHTFLTQQGYVVLDMDYRASKGYGRDWRTAIYQQMGTPELEDLLDGKRWMVEQLNVDTQKVGIYGGSYGGFMTFMSLFKAPDAFAAGASLRPVTDWASYNHAYTSNILNTPQVDPEAYNRSSPIEFAQGLKKPLLIAHGMVDDNVFFKDSVRLVQRLIELEKTRYFETAIYPVEPHGFREPSSWLDEYTRIYMLFEEHVK